MKKERIIAYSSLLIPLYFYLSWIYVRIIYKNLSQANKVIEFKKFIFFDPVENAYIIGVTIFLLALISLIYFWKLLDRSKEMVPKSINFAFVILNVVIILLTIWGML